ncbi:MAG: HEAT repeat domain-containing protein, partial [bacterium]
TTSDMARYALERIPHGSADKALRKALRKTYGKGRVFYCVLGHNHNIFWNPAVLQHYLDGIQFAMGDLAAETKPTVDKFLAEIASYEYGQSREALSNLADYLREMEDSPKELKRMEKRLSGMLRTDATPAGKQFICKQLSVMGSKESVPALAEMLTDPTTSDMARYALERIPHGSADKALRKALPKTHGKVKVGIINTLGRRRDAKSVSDLRKLINNTDPMVASAAVAALGEIANKNAAKELKKAMSQTTGNLRMQVSDSYLKCADEFAAQGKLSKALEIYQELYKPGEPKSIRFAALRGWIRTSPENATEIILDVLKSDGPEVHPIAIGILDEINEPNSIIAIAAELPNLSIQDQVQLITLMAGRSEPGLRLATTDAAKSIHIDVRIAALKALATLGDESVVTLLAEAAAKEGPESETARESLYRLAGLKTDETILANIGSVDAKIKVELIRSVGKREIYAAKNTLLETATHENAEVRLESIRVLKIVSDKSDLPTIVDLLVQAQDDSERLELEKTVVAVAHKIPDKGSRAKAVLDALPFAEDIIVRTSLLKVLGKMGDKSALPVLRAGLDDSNEEVRVSSIRALSEWPGSEPVADLLKIARTSKNKIHKVLALRGYIRLIRMDNKIAADAAVDMYKQAMDLASDMSEKRMVLSGLSDVSALVALTMAADYLGEPSLRPEAEAAVVGIAGNILGSYPDESESALQRISQTSENESYRQRALELMGLFEKFEDYLVAWQVSGPYMMDGGKLLDYAFAPEKPGDQNVVWQIMPAGTNPDNSWRLE